MTRDALHEAPSVAEAAVRGGSCACGAVRYATTGAPRRISVCHCKDCQRRTGSAFGVACYFPRASVRLLGGATRTFERRSDAGRRVALRFCERCGTTVLWEAEVVPELVGIAAGTFDDTGWLAPKLHVWARSAQGWVRFPEDAEVLDESNLGQR